MRTSIIRTRMLSLLVLPILFVASSMGQNDGRRRSSITVAMDGLTCTTLLGAGIFPALTWTLTATDTISSTGGGGTASGKVISTADVSKRADNCSVELFEAGVTGKHFNNVIITQQDGRGRTIKVTLKHALIASYQLQGDQAEARPSEHISFAFEDLTVAF